MIRVIKGRVKTGPDTIFNTGDIVTGLSEADEASLISQGVCEVVEAAQKQEPASEKNDGGEPQNPTPDPEATGTDIAAVEEPVGDVKAEEATEVTEESPKVDDEAEAVDLEEGVADTQVNLNMDDLVIKAPKKAKK